MKTQVVIPARLQSTRLPRKVLADIHGKPLIQHVWERVHAAQMVDDVFIAVDDDTVQAVAQGFGAQVLMSDPACQSGTERIASVLDQLDADFIINVQGDEPLIQTTLIDALVTRWQANPVDLVTPIFRITDVDDLFSSHVVKVVRGHDDRILYFSRQAVPHLRDVPEPEWLTQQAYWGHIGVYGYRRQVLANYDQLPASPLEASEKLEQLRFLEAGYQFLAVETDYRPIAVDVAEDLEHVRQILAK
jgi:3-deoxy-manno-octulosonate cytidylyltransferase (CMP-KDO synthetase)